MAKSKKKRTPAKKKSASKITKIILPDKVPSSDFLGKIIIGLFIALTTAFVAGLMGSIADLSRPIDLPTSNIQGKHGGLGQKYQAVREEVKEFLQTQTQSQYEVVKPGILQDKLSTIRYEIDTHQRKQALADMSRLHQQVKTYNVSLAAHLKTQSAPTAKSVPTEGVVVVPILLFHYTPPDFDRQLTILEQKHYTVINLDTLAAGLANPASLPSKPVVITFDDGFGNQMSAFEILRRHKMPAIYYIIDAGERSKWCIGAGRRYGDPLQPPSGCGDAYLSWNQVRALDKSGLITIASHTVDHENLATASASEQEFQIIKGKNQLESQLGHPVRHFAYPYGGFSATTIDIVRRAGFVTAVTTLPGTAQTAADVFSLHRSRDTYTLP